MKACSKCKINKEDLEFWIRNDRKSGLSSECRSCAGERRRNKDKSNQNETRKKWYLRNAEKIKKINIEYARKNKDKVNSNHRKWYEENFEIVKEQRENQRVRIREWAKKYTKQDHIREKLKANRLLNYNVSTGKIIRPLTCSLCGNERKLEGHHHDYNKPLDVIWVCRKCHVMIHRNLNKE